MLSAQEADPLKLAHHFFPSCIALAERLVTMLSWLLLTTSEAASVGRLHRLVFLESSQWSVLFLRYCLSACFRAQ